MLHATDLFLASACLEKSSEAWEALFKCRASRTDALLVDALRQRASRLYPRDEERQEEAVLDFWGYLIAGQRDGSRAILERYDGLRPLVPWLIRVFHNRHLSELRRGRGEAQLPDQDGWAWVGDEEEPVDPRWHELFRDCARGWLSTLTDDELLLLGLRLRYKLSQREVARVVGIHEGNVTRRLDGISERAHLLIERDLRELGWSGDDLFGLIRKEMYEVLLDEPRLSAGQLAAILASRGKSLPNPGSPG
jgi:RNA polymerase sigma factor (sigma-70 family)